MYVFNALVSTELIVVSEFEFINNIKSKYGLTRVGDDCAVLPKDTETDLLLTADMLVEDIDFRLDWTTPEYLGHKALAVSLSDIAAMGGTPKWAMLSIAVAEQLWKTDFQDRFYEGWFALANKYGVELIGGDISRSPDKLVTDSTIVGEVSKGQAILRSGAKPGDFIFVSGVIGGAAGGLKLIENQIQNRVNAFYLVQRQLRPQPQVILGNLLQNRGLVSSMIDLSDGLSSDLGHLCESGHVGATIYVERLPIDADLGVHFPTDVCLHMALNGGEDFELLFTSPEKNILLPETHPVTCIGEITANVGIIELIDGKKTTILQKKGYRHF